MLNEREGERGKKKERENELDRKPDKKSVIERKSESEKRNALSSFVLSISGKLKTAETEKVTYWSATTSCWRTFRRRTTSTKGARGTLYSS